jgi:hypothetical protein
MTHLPTSDLFVWANHVAVCGVRVLAVRKLKLASRLVVQRLLVRHVGVDVRAHGFDLAVGTGQAGTPQRRRRQCRLI